MKTLAAAVLLFLALIQGVAATPFLVCDPVTPQSDPNLNPVLYDITGLAAQPISSAAFHNTDGTLQLKYDLSTLPNGTYAVTASAVNVFGGASAASAVLNFTKGAPGTPTNLRIVP